MFIALTGLHLKCNVDDDCIRDAVCKVPTNSSNGSRMCECKEGYEEEDHECSSKCRSSVRMFFYSICFDVTYYYRPKWLWVDFLYTCLNLPSWFMSCNIKDHLLSNICLNQSGSLVSCNFNIIGHRDYSPFRFCSHKGSMQSGSLPSAILPSSTVNTMNCCSFIRRRNNDVEFIKSLCTYHCFIAALFLFTRYSVKCITCNSP
jgi:hypothetical protein